MTGIGNHQDERGVLSIDGQGTVVRPRGGFDIPCYLNEGEPELPTISLNLRVTEDGAIEVDDYLVEAYGYLNKPRKDSVPAILHGSIELERIELVPQHEQAMWNTTAKVQCQDGSFSDAPLVATTLTFPAVIDKTQMYISGVSIEATLGSDGEIEMPDADLIHLGYGGVEHVRRPGDRLVSVEATLIIHRVSFGYQDQEGAPGVPTAR